MPEPDRPPRATILIADDVAHLRRLCAILLEPHGFQMLEAEDGPGAVEIYRRHRPDIVLLDIGMPGGGLAALREIKGLDAGAHIIMLTGQHDELTVRTVLAAGARGYVVKPFTRQRLLAAVERLLQP